MFDAYEIHPERVPGRRGAPEWLAELKRLAPSATVAPDDPALVLRGDVRDGLSLDVTTLTWGMPNLWMAVKGLDPLAGLVAFTSVDQAFSHRPDGYRFGRCLVPVTGLVIDGSVVSDPDQTLFTLAGLVGSIDQGDDYATGMCFLMTSITEAGATYPAPLVVAAHHHDDWMDGWHDVERVRSCCSPLLRSRLIS